MSELAQTYQVEQIIFVMNIECFYYYIIFVKGFFFLFCCPLSLLWCNKRVCVCVVCIGSHQKVWPLNRFAFVMCDHLRFTWYGMMLFFILHEWIRLRLVCNKPNRVILSMMVAGVKRVITILCIVGCTGCVPNYCVAASLAAALVSPGWSDRGTDAAAPTVVMVLLPPQCSFFFQ